jgi:hypothetical protein
MDELARDLRAHVAHFGRRLRWRDGWLLAQRWLWPAVLGVVCIQLAGRIWPVERLELWALIPLAAWLVFVVGVFLLRRLPPLRVARRVDAELNLKERLATALILEEWIPGKAAYVSPSGNDGSDGELPSAFRPSLVALQRQDALAAARAVDARRAFRLRWLGRPLALATILLAAALALALAPNPMDDLIAERAAIAQAAEQQAEEIEKLSQEIQKAQELTPERRAELLRRLQELAEQLRANRGDRQQALADLSRVEEALGRQLDANADARQAAMQALATQLQALALAQNDQAADLSDAAEALEQLAQSLEEMGGAQRQELAQSLAQMAARAGQAGDGNLAQALAALGQAIQSGDAEAAQAAAQAAADAMAQAREQLAEQATLRQALSQLQAGRQALAQAGTTRPGLAQGQGQGQSQGQGQGQGQGQPGGGGGTKADSLPPANSVGQAGRPQGAGRPGTTGQLDQQVYAPWERRPGSGQQLSITGQDTGQGETQLREQQDPLPGTPGQALVPYSQVYQDYLDAANQTMERSYIPPGLRDYVRDYFSRLEP